MAAVAVGAGGGPLVAASHGPAVHAPLVGLHRVGERDLVAGHEVGVRVAAAAGAGLVPLGHGRGRLVDADQGVGLAVARGAGGGVAGALPRRGAVGAGGVVL